MKTTVQKPEADASERLLSPISYFRGCRGSTKAIGQGTIKQFLNQLRNPSSKLTSHTAQRPDKATDPKGYKNWKEGTTDGKELGCPAIIPGQFKERTNDGCLQYSQFMLFDVDALEGEDVLPFYIERCAESKHVFAAWPSPSMLGLRIIVHTESQLSTHKYYYSEICKRLAKLLGIETDKAAIKRLMSEGKSREEAEEALKAIPHVDTSTNNIGRIWFFCAVPEHLVYINKVSETFILEPPAPPRKEKVKRLPIQPTPSLEGISEGDKVAICLEKVKRQSLPTGRNNFIYAFASELRRHGVSEGRALSECEQYADPQAADPFGLPEIRKTVSSAYQRHQSEFSDAQIMKYSQMVNGRQPAPSPSINDKQPNRFCIEKTPQIAIPENYKLDNTPAPEELSTEDNKYFWTESVRGKSVISQVSNFVMIPLYLLKGPNPKRLFELVNTYGQRTTICVSSKVLASSKELTAEIEGRGEFVVEWTSSQFAGIKRVIYHNVKEAEEISVLGHQEEHRIFAFANGVFSYDQQAIYEINDFGIAEPSDESAFYLPPLSSVNEDARLEFNNERKFRYLESPVTFGEWSKGVCEVYEENGKLGLCYLIAAIFRDVVFSVIDCFPILFLFGPPRTGKSVFRESFLALYGEPQTPISLGSSSSPKGFARKVAQFSNALICFEEYKNNIKLPLIEMLKSMYDGIGYERAQMTNDNRTHSTPVKSACIVAGQEMPTKESALFSRSILLEFNKTTRDDSTAYNKLKAMESQGLGNVLLELLSCRGTMEREFPKVYHATYGELKDILAKDFQDKKDPRAKGISDRNVKNIAAILAAIRVVAQSVDLPFEYEEARDIAIEKLKVQDEIMSNTSEVNEFWQLFEYLVSEGWITKGTDFGIKDGRLLIRLSRIYPKYREYGEKQRLNVLDKQTLVRYLKQQSYFISNDKENRDQFKERLSGGAYWYYCFKYDEVKNNFENDEI